ncbi:hypothetical protein [Breoghania sp.]|uniref:hypothetical protein n=1 Tax=Breoghania sp. TaxID=2065378 RepID=UPI002630251C|nr:hypothetical protein [Breoghania sp.]MDJ0932390.1 hypothetical protein [Breoghania sp.]
MTTYPRRCAQTTLNDACGQRIVRTERPDEANACMPVRKANAFMIGRLPVSTPMAILAALTAAFVVAGPAQAATVTTERIQLPASDTETPEGLDNPEAGDAAQGKPVGAPEAGVPLPEIHYGAGELPKPVMRLRKQILDAARSGEVERLRPVLKSNEMPPTLSLTRIGDPIDFLKSSSGDANGREILAILSEVIGGGLGACGCRHAAGDVCLALFRALSAEQAAPAAGGGALSHPDRRRRGGDARFRRLCLLPRRHRPGRHMALFRGRRIGAGRFAGAD